MIPRGASDAYLAPYHVFRSKAVVIERFCRSSLHRRATYCARHRADSRFPIPDDDDHAETNTEAGWLRAADLIGQLADPLYPRKINALFHEFAETGMNEKLGYTTPADLAERYPSFFWTKIEPYIGDARRHLEQTVEGRQWLAQLYSNVFAMEHNRQGMGPHLSA